MPRLPSTARSRKLGARLSRWDRIERAVYLLHKRIAKLEGKRKRIGFQTIDARGDGIEQDWDDYEEIPEET